MNDELRVTSAAELVAEARASAAPIEEQLRAHPYILAVEAGRIPKAELQRFAGEQWHIISSDLRSVAHLVARFGGASRAGSFFLEVLGGERAALQALAPLAHLSGTSFEELAEYEPLAGAHAYTCYMAWLGMYGSAGEVGAAYVVNFPAWGESCGRLSRGLRGHYGFSMEAVAFFDLFATPVQGFEEAALAVIQDDLDQRADALKIRRSVRLLQAYELLYWDTLWAAAQGAGGALTPPSPTAVGEGASGRPSSSRGLGEGGVGGGGR